MKKQTTRRALLLSVLSLVLCVSMLTGTTFAWFTDSVTSANNIIVAGNLDVNLYYQNDEVTTWKEVDAATNVFKKDTLWEPGHTEVVKLKVVNEGTLALKYQLGVNVASEQGSINVKGDDFLLSKYIKYGIAADGNYTRDTAIAAVDTNATALYEAYTSESIELAPGEEKAVTLVVYMPTEVGNEANALTGKPAPTINLGINVMATQLAYEEDSFGKDYDEPAVYPGNSDASGLGDEKIVLVTAGENQMEVTLAPELVSDIDNGTVESVSIKSSLPKTEVDGEKVTVTYSTFELVDQDGNAIDLSDNTVAIPVKLYVGTEYAGMYATVAHDDVLVANQPVDAEGYVTYSTTHFCEITVELSKDEPAKGMGSVKNEAATDLTNLVQVLFGNHYYTVSQGMANSWITLSNAQQIVADVYVPEDLIAFATMYNNGDLTDSGGTHTDLYIKNDLDYKGYNWVPISRWYTNIHGEGHTLSNLNNSLLGCVYDCHIDKLTLENVTAAGSAAGVVAKELAGDIFITELTIAGENTVKYVKDNAENYPEYATGIGAICGVSLIAYNGNGNVDINVTGTIDVDYTDVVFGTKSSFEVIGVDKEFGLNVYSKNQNVNVTVAEGGAINTSAVLVFDAAGLKAAADIELTDGKKNNILMLGSINVEDLVYVNFKTESVVNGCGNSLIRATASGNPLLINTTNKVTFENVKFESEKGNAVLATKKVGANIEVNNCEFINHGAPSTGNTGVQVYANNVTMTFNNCTFNNMPIETNSSYPEDLKLVFNGCTFNWVGDNCPGFIKVANYVDIEIDLNDCKMTYTTDSKYDSAKEMISCKKMANNCTVNVNGLEIVGTRNNEKVWPFITYWDNVTVNATDVTYTFNGETVDVNKYFPE